MQRSRNTLTGSIPDATDTESDSDLDITPQELGPVVASEDILRSASTKSRRPLRTHHVGNNHGGEIPLQSLRNGGSRRSESRAGHKSGHPFQRSWTDKSEEYQDLLDEHPDTGGLSSSLATRSGSERDDAPLLPQDRNGGRAPIDRPAGFWRRLFSKWPPRLGTKGTFPPSPANDGSTDPTSVSARTVLVGQSQRAKYPANIVSNARYTAWSFLPVTLYNEFSLFLNMYYLLVALSQIIPALRIGYLSTYVAPLIFVLAITLGKEALDDVGRRRRDAEANAESYTVLEFPGRQHGGTSGYRSRRSSQNNTIPKSGALKKKKQYAQGVQAQSNTEDDNSQTGGLLSSVREVLKRSRDLRVGDVLKLQKGQRVPADVIILGSYAKESPTGVREPTRDLLPLDARINGDLLDNDLDAPMGAATNTKKNVIEDGSGPDVTLSATETAGETFIRTDQLDGETDWKLRLASPLTQGLRVSELQCVRVVASDPEASINRFVGTVKVMRSIPDSANETQTESSLGDMESSSAPDSNQLLETRSASLTVDNTAWANTILASNSVTLAAIVYTGSETRQALSTTQSRPKTGLLEHEINALTKILCILTLCLSLTLVALEGFESTPDRKWYVAVMRFLILFSTIIPISLRVNLDMGKTVYSWFIEKDDGIKGAVVRTSTIPEELGRIEYLLSDKTGTLTQNEMELKKIHVGTVSYASEAMDEVMAYVRQAFSAPASSHNENPTLSVSSSNHTGPFMTSTTRTRRDISSRVRDIVLALAICHNVTPTSEEKDGTTVTTYQASSPDEIAIVQWTENVGLRVMYRDRKMIVLQATDTGQTVVRVRILDVFPFTSEGKRMGIIVQILDHSQSTGGDIWFYQKGADTVMTSIVAANDWLDEETSNMAREGLRTLVVGRKRLSASLYGEFASKYKEASLALQERDSAMANIITAYLEQDVELLGVTGVEDKLQQDVKPSIELLRNAGIKIWMLTGDKVETARCVAVSARLIARGQYVHTVSKLKRKNVAHDSLELLRSKTDACLLIDGESLALLLTHFRDSFTSIAVRLPTVIACRCSPSQKAEIAQLIRAHTKKRVCCIGDGGNDVSMIQAADVGVGIVGKEGRQASLAADFSIEHFCHLPKLLLWHGRNSYKRSAKLAQFVIHRGLIISVCQTMFSIASKFEPVALYQDWLLVGYATVYTMAPVFSLVLDRDVDEGLAKLYPELYRELIESRSLSYRTFFVWVLISIYQGGMIQGLSQILVDVHGSRMIAVSFTVLVINELIMVAFEVTTWHPVMIFALMGTALVYFGSIPFLGRYFDLGFVISVGFLWRVMAISAISLIPPYTAKRLRRTLKPPSYRKVQGI